MEKTEKIKNLTDNNEIINLLMEATEDYFEILYELWNKLSLWNDFEKISLINAYIELSQNSTVREIMLSSVVPKYRTCEQTIGFMKKWVEVNNKFPDKICYGSPDDAIFTDEIILQNRTYDEQLKLMDIFSEVINQRMEANVYCLFRYKAIVKYLTCEQQIELIHKYMDKGKYTAPIIDYFWVYLGENCEDFDCEMDDDLRAIILIVGIMDIPFNQQYNMIEEYLVTRNSSENVSMYNTKKYIKNKFYV